jgi:hypothetical protein
MLEFVRQADPTRLERIWRKWTVRRGRYPTGYGASIESLDARR